jgi:hypothetical protein
MAWLDAYVAGLGATLIVRAIGLHGMQQGPSSIARRSASLTPQDRSEGDNAAGASSSSG